MKKCQKCTEASLEGALLGRVGPLEHHIQNGAAGSDPLSEREVCEFTFMLIPGEGKVVSYSKEWE